MDWDKLSNDLRQEVAEQDRVNYITTATLPKKYIGFKGSYAFQLNDGTIYLIADTIKGSDEDIQDILKHEMAHRVLGHTQLHEEGEEKDVPVAEIIQGMPESLRHEVDVNLLLRKTYGTPSADDFKGEVGGWLLPYVKNGNVPYGDVFSVIRKEILDRQDVPSEWKKAIVVLRKQGARKFAAKYGYSVDYADKILDYGREPGDAEFNDLVKHVWYGESTDTVGGASKAMLGSEKSKRRSVKRKRKPSAPLSQHFTAVRGLRK